MKQRARADNLTVCYRNKQMDVSFSCVCHVVDNEFRPNIVKVVCGSTRLSPRGSAATLITSMTKFMVNNRTDAWKTDVNLLNWFTGCEERRKAGETWMQVKKLTGRNKGICSRCECGADGNEYCEDSRFVCLKIPGCQETEKEPMPDSCCPKCSMC